MIGQGAFSITSLAAERHDLAGHLFGQACMPATLDNMSRDDPIVLAMLK